MKRLLRFIAVLFMGLTAGITLLGGVGTSCVALNPSAYESMKGIAPFQWLYILYVLVGIALGILGVRATVHLVKGKEGAEKSALFVLIGGVVVGGIHMASSRALRGSSMPVDAVVYFTVLTLIIFLIFRLPKIKALALFQKDGGGDADRAGGITAFVTGILVLSVQIWAGSSHMIMGVNYADAFHNAMLLIGSGLMLSGAILVFKTLLAKTGEPAQAYKPDR